MPRGLCGMLPGMLLPQDIDAARRSGADLRLLDAAGFRGPLIIENYSWRDRGSDPLEELARARDFILGTAAR